MKKRSDRLKILLLVILVIALLVSLITPLAASAAEAETTACVSLEGSNVGAQHYSRWSAPVYSSLIKTDEGYMRVQARSQIEDAAAVYYDENFNRIRIRSVAQELPLFGGFFASGSHYFLVTGQSNPEEDDAVEVYRITKYDQDWNRLGACGLYGANTYIPFDAGSCRMAMDGQYLVIRTCHEMYASSDGLHHQANVTIEVDTEAMTVTDSFTSVMNTSYGYVSHSFNQFIQIEDHKIVSVDHGDAYPRSICLMQYPTNVTGGTFQSDSVQTVDVLAFPGSIGDNTTGAAVGGFAIAKDQYVIAGHSVVQDDSNTSRSTRNIFVATVDRSTKTPQIHWLTDYAEGEDTTQTPQMVQIAEDRLMVLWTRSGKLYYGIVDETGSLTGPIYEKEGRLSDCAPIVDQNSVIWYTWKNGTETFYRIPLSDPNSLAVSETVYGHDYQWVSTTDGIATIRCTKCGEETTGRVPTGFSIYWRRTDTTGSYYSSPPSMELGVGAAYMISGITYSATADRTFSDFVIEPQDPTACTVDMDNKRVDFLRAGSCRVYVYPKFNPEVRKTVTFQVLQALQSVSLSAEPSSPQPFGRSIRLYAGAEGGKGALTWTFTETDPAGTQTVLQSGSSNTCTWNPSNTGTYQLQVEAKDPADGNRSAADTLSFTIEPAPVQAKGTVSAGSSLVYGQAVREAGFSEVSFYAPVSGKTVSGSIAYAEPDVIPEPGIYAAAWVFTPDSSNYLPVEGQLTIQVAKQQAVIETYPTAEAVTYHPQKTLADIPLVGGKASVAGTWRWTDPETPLKTPSVTGGIEFVPEQTNRYEGVTGTLQFEVEKAPVRLIDLQAADLVYGQSLEESTLSGRAVLREDPDVTVEGSFCWADPTFRPTVADSDQTAFTVQFYPEDGSSYESAETTLTVHVEKREHPEVMPPTSISVPFRTNYLSDSLLKTPDWGFRAEDLLVELVAGETAVFEAQYKGADADNYQITTAEVSVYRSTCDHDGAREVRGAVEATCTEEGATGDTVCLLCGEILSTSQPIPAKGHSWDAGEITKIPTCVETGEKTYTCEACGLTRTEPVETDPSNHVHIVDTAKIPATDQADGQTAGQHCADCGTILKQPKTIPMITSVSITAPAYTFDGKAKTAVIVIQAGQKTLAVDKDYSVAYKNNDKAGTATVTVTMKGNYAGSFTGSFTIARRSITDGQVTGIVTKTYTGKPLKQEPELKVGKILLVKGKDFTVTYKNNTKAGQATIILQGIGNYKGKSTKYFTIKPKKTSLSELTNPKTKTLKITWKKAPSGTGYQIQYGKSSTFSKAKSVTVAKLSTTAKTIKDLAKGKYYVRIRVYKTIGTKKVYSTWSTKKSKTIK